MKEFSLGNRYFNIWICILAATIAGADAQVYVSPHGNNSGPGSQAHPVRTLQRAIDLSHEGHERSIVLAGGVYRLNQPTVLSPEDSGLTIAAAPHASPILSGAVRIAGWKLEDAKKNLWVANAPAALKNSRQFYVNGVRANRTRGRVPVGPDGPTYLSGIYIGTNVGNLDFYLNRPRKTNDFHGLGSFLLMSEEWNANHSSMSY